MPITNHDFEQTINESERVTKKYKNNKINLCCGKGQSKCEEKWIKKIKEKKVKRCNVKVTVNTLMMMIACELTVS